MRPRPELLHCELEDAASVASDTTALMELCRFGASEELENDSDDVHLAATLVDSRSRKSADKDALVLFVKLLVFL
jgi:hypothetical protein